ncbi:hypothetical protein P691DRAFT_771789 [Macrolepiota fuliginosa MF-IS2]|uniref:Uncharacterized protein n=1 Tax=Macrolepiota fuliginosa MF-IS2 TaxID=1400762 RepID=A0A9P5XM92_9AGAR|nr:hypothetical protein P691DRAFT_771789 [Macrolepiota fuliginosa MF-IS2]
MDHSDTLSLTPPPPAYSEQEFNQKISLASQLSLAVHENQRHHEHEGEAWEAWDEATFQAAAGKLSLQDSDIAQSTGESSAQSSKDGVNASIKPLRIHKKNLSGTSSVPSGKQKPSWLSEAEENSPGASESSALATPTAPAYTPNTPSNPTSPQSAVSPIRLPNPYASLEWGTATPAPVLPDPYAGQPEEDQPDESPNAPPTLADDTLPPPPFTSNSEDRLFNPYGDPGTPAAPTSMPTSATQSNPDVSFNDNVMGADQLRILDPNPSAIEFPMPTKSRYSVSASAPQSTENLPGHASHVPSRLQPANRYRNSMIPPSQNTAVPQINVDLSMAYGKRPAVMLSNGPQSQQQAFNPAAFYNSAVSAHLGSYSKQPISSIEPRRQSHQPLTSTALYTFQQTNQNNPSRYNRLPPSSIAPRNPHNLTLQDPLIRSPTPTYPTSITNNPMPQMLAAASEDYCGHQRPAPQLMAKGRATWTDTYPYR